VPFTDLLGIEESPKFSPDGKLVAFQWNGPGKDNQDIYIKQVGRGEQPFRLTTDPADDKSPVWSPDGSEIAFVRVSGETATIYTVPSLGGVERRLYESRAALLGGGLSWAPDGRSLAFPEKSAVESPARIYLLPLDTRQKIPLTSPPPEIWGDFTPEFSPDGRRVAFVRVSSFATADIWIQPVSSGEATPLTHKNYEDISRPSWTADGSEVVFAARQVLFRVLFTGGVPQAIPGIGENVSDPAICGNHMVFTQYSTSQSRIWRMRGPNYKGKDRSSAPLLVSTRWDSGPDYSPDGKKLTFNSGRSGFSEIWTSGSDGSKPEQLTYLRVVTDSPHWSPDGRRIVFGCTPAEYEEIFILGADGGTPQRLMNEKSQGELPTWSRDGRWIYFASNRSGAYQVWKVPSGGGQAVQITREGGFYAVESFDGETLYYTKPGRQSHDTGPIWKVPREGGKETSVMEREILFLDWALRPEGIYFSAKSGRKYMIDFLGFQSGKITPFFQEETPNKRAFLTISPDGEWFAYVQGLPQESDLMLVENFR
jgi:Tol biopolymer transport system component